MNKKINIAIDGPAGAGKSTVAKKVADRLSFVYIDTGAMYRALTYLALKTNTDIHNEETLNQLLLNAEISLKNEQGEQTIYLNDEEVSDKIRSSEVTNHVSYVAKHRAVREEMLKRQQQLAQNGYTVMDGRDIGTAVLPDAKVKIFLSASVEERARRRHQENVQKGEDSNLDTLIEEIRKRDQIDSERDVAPLVKADDAIEIDTTDRSIEQVTAEILTIVSAVPERD
ncbi:(d)CMP kinase [Texcoconibacillus texcoconensis]|uniref:Cytidylate kinase n=1 Tax=Texcoconibacillus texcoconensis TaxID=1095777 RepID=A0A840QNF0_9BACI|nr:(d)CMP kinase [Texcoconibacillus texcoconensis]MBB5172912.1 cytidylate kinase [Texcoconibacillus texcoconensis]